MLVSRDEFDRRLASGQLHLALVGMSNSGKSTSSILLERSGFVRYEVDGQINRELGFREMSDAADWLGYPYEEKYPRQKQKYLELEEHFTLVEPDPDANFVLDTTGSVIHLRDETRRWLRSHFLVVGLSISTELASMLIRDYFSNPKTVIWGDEFEIAEKETHRDALIRCYPSLLENRVTRYQELADVEIPAELARSAELTSDRLLESIRSRLSPS